MFWDRVAWVYDVFAKGINRKANQRICAVVGELISPHGRSVGVRLRDGSAQWGHRASMQTAGCYGFLRKDAETGEKEGKTVGKCPL